MDWPKTLHGGIVDVLKLSVQCTKGTFSEFVNAVGNGQSYAWMMADNNTGHFRNDFGPVSFLSDNSLLSLDDLLSRERELAGEYEIANDGWGNTDLGHVVSLDGILRVHLIPTNGADVATALGLYGFGETAKISFQPNPRFPQMQNICIDMPAIGEDQKKLAPMASNQDKDVGFLTRPFANGDNMIDVHRMYVEAYILGMLSRYFPSKWMSLLRSDKGDIARSVILPAIARVESAFPRLIRDQLY